MNALCRNGHPPRLAAWTTPQGPRCDDCLGYSLEASAFRAEIEFTDFGDCALMGIRDIAWFCEARDTSRIGDTHIIKGWVDYRDENGPLFTELIAGLGDV